MARRPPPPSTTGFSGGFFLPAQRSMHCAGGFFTQDPIQPIPQPKAKAKPPSTSFARPAPTPSNNQVDADKARSTPVRTAKPRAPPRSTSQPRHVAETSQTRAALDNHVNAKFELAIKELRDIKGEYEQRSTRPASVAAAAAAPDKTQPITTHRHMEEQPEQTTIGGRAYHSPNKKLKIAEMVIRKLYKKNLELEKALGEAKKDMQVPATPFVATLATPPTVESVQEIESQKEDYLKYLAAEQDKTIQELKRKIDELTNTPMEQGLTKPGKANSSAVISRLQKRLQEAMGESTRQKSSYLKLKGDYKRLLLQRTRTISGNSEIDAHARELLALMERRLLKVEDEREQEMALYNMKLFETEQQNCDEYVAKRMLEQEIQKVTKDVKERDEIDDRIEKCMFGVFERLHQVEQENIKLREAHDKLTKFGT
ncbi:Aste57867_14920 [Aphanomyces stellatus]|uniref:Aste57867_14920 protein n=1 Tax=Aphanomyces stellatus TaxID=120398 RepID=A0A485L2S3_9STRA|nr:hypothetical protein As57867_014864 [Aphanomyces stellatus]VFT91735.1 Aste57867_14920 [Aphanomyces stellatus]